MNASGHAPGSTASLVLGLLGIALAFAGPLVSLSVVVSAFAVIAGLVARQLGRRRPARYLETSLRRAAWGVRAGGVGLVSASVMWWLWSSGALYP